MRRKTLKSHDQSVFTEEMLTSLARDLKSRRLPMDRQQISDDLVTGLRAIITKDGRVTFHASYTLGESRPFLILGEMGKISLTQARELTKTIKALAANGINVQEGLHERLIRELLTKGVKWRPT